MKKISLYGTLLVSLVAFPLRAAESPSSGPPKVLQIYREEAKVGKAPAHVKVERGVVAAAARANWPTHYIAMTTITGPTEAWFLTGYPSFAAWEKDRDDTEKNKAFTADLDRLIEKDGELLTNGRSLVAVLREARRVLDRWWTDEPILRRYFEVVLTSGENTVVFRDRERGGWSSQRGA